MMNLLMKIYTKIFPASKHQVNYILQEMKNYMGGLSESQCRIEKTIRKQELDYINLSSEIEYLKKTMREWAQNFQKSLQLQTEYHEKIMQQMEKIQVLFQVQMEDAYVRITQDRSDLEQAVQMLSNKTEQIIMNIANMADMAEKEQKDLDNTNEIIWAFVFNNAIYKSNWLRDKTFYPGRWAVGYPVLYVLYRVLNEVKPQNILELGLGQSTKMITQYAAAYNDVKHYVVEHDSEWIDFFERDIQISSGTQIVKLDREMGQYLDADAVRRFKGFKERFEKERFDLVFIDAPLGGDMKQYARIDILQIIPECLKDSFVIMMDDYDRIGEKNTGQSLEILFKEHSISYVKGIYSGQKQMALWASENNVFLTTM